MNAKSIGMFVLLFAAGGLLSLSVPTHWAGRVRPLLLKTKALLCLLLFKFSAASAAVPTDFVEAAEASVEAVVHGITAERVQNYYNLFNDLFLGRPSTHNDKRFGVHQVSS